MWRSKRFIIVAVVAAVLLAGSIGGIALAQENGDGSQPGVHFEALWDSVAVIYEQNTGVTLDTEALKAAFAEARSEMQSEAMQNRLQNLVEQGQITQEQADEHLQWQESRPDVPFKHGFRGHGGFHGMGGLHAHAE